MPKVFQYAVPIQGHFFSIAGCKALRQAKLVRKQLGVLSVRCIVPGISTYRADASVPVVDR